MRWTGIRDRSDLLRSGDEYIAVFRVILQLAPCVGTRGFYLDAVLFGIFRGFDDQVLADVFTAKFGSTSV